MPITHCELVVNSLLRTLTCTLMNTTGTLLLFYWSCTAFGFSYKRWNLTYGERSVVYCCAWRQWGHMVHPVARPNSYRVTQQNAERGEGKGGEAKRGSAPLLLRNRVPWGFWILSHPAWGDYATIYYFQILMFGIEMWVVYIITTVLWCAKIAKPSKMKECSERRLIGHWLTRVIKTRNTIEASITLDGLALTDSLIRWSPNEWPSVCQKIPAFMDKMFWTSYKPAQ
jgi:hypothetical protein